MTERLIIVKHEAGTAKALALMRCVMFLLVPTGSLVCKSDAQEFTLLVPNNDAETLFLPIMNSVDSKICTVPSRAFGATQ